MNTTVKITAAIVAVTTTVVLMAGIAGLVVHAENQAYAAAASTQYVMNADKTTVIVTRTA